VRVGVTRVTRVTRVLRVRRKKLKVKKEEVKSKEGSLKKGGETFVLNNP